MGLDLVELIMGVERTFVITISNPEAEQSATVGQLFDLIVRKREERHHRAPAQRYAGALWESYLDLVEESLSVPRDQLTPDAHFVRDLKVD